MTVSEQATPATTHTFLGRPIAHWFFGLRTWAAMMLALGVAFWMQLDGAAEALITATILAQPTRGHIFSKVLYRLLGTAIGLTVSIVIAGLFNDLRTLFIVAVAAWQALCVYVAKMLDGFRAYAAILSGYTVAIVAVSNIDSPQDTFTTGINRGAAILIGIAATALIVDMFEAPNVLPSLLKRVESAHAEVRAFALRMFERGSAGAGDVARLMGRVTALRADAVVLGPESIAGGARTAAARRAVSELLHEARAARILGATLPYAGRHGSAWRGRLEAALQNRDAAQRLLARAAEVIATDGADPTRLIAARSVEAVVDRDRLVAEAIRDLETGEGSASAPKLAPYRSCRDAGRNALWTFLTVLISGTLLVLVGLPDASTTLLWVCVLACQAANSRNPRSFMISGVIAFPLGFAAAGINLFLVLDGSDAFPLLALALVPTVLVAGLLMKTGKPGLSALGYTVLLFTAELMSLTNHQTYNPSEYLNKGLYIFLAALLLAIAAITLLPTDDVRRRRWYLASIRRELFRAVEGRSGWFRRSVEESSFRASDRLGQIAGLKYRDGAERDATVAYALHLSEVTFAARRTRDALVEAGGRASRDGLAAVAGLDVPGLRAAAAKLETEPDGRWAAANVARTAALVECYRSDIALAREGKAP